MYKSFMLDTMLDEREPLNMYSSLVFVVVDTIPNAQKRFVNIRVADENSVDMVVSRSNASTISLQIYSPVKKQSSTER